MELRWYQSEALAAIYRALAQPDVNPCVVLPTGCHAKGHPILMYDGTIRHVEDVRVGDLLMGPDSKPRYVHGLCRGHGKMYLVTPIKGDPFIVNEDHILSLQCTSEGKKSFACYKKGGEIENVSIEEYQTKSKSWRHIRKLYHVPVDFSNNETLPIPPYIVGAFLGDGYLNGTIGITKPDIELLNEFKSYAASMGCSFTKKSSDKYTWQIVNQKGRENPVKEKLVEIGIYGTISATKHVPQIYLTASREIRLELLAGLLDSDGHMSHGGFDFISKSERLARDVVFLSRSLGLAAHVAQCEKSCQNDFTGIYHRVSISGDCSIIPCRIERKKSPPRLQKKNVLRTGFKIEPIGDGEYFGFIVSDDHLYVDGNFMVHHNSGKTPVMAEFCKQSIKAWPNVRICILAHVRELLEQAEEKLSIIAPELFMNVGVYSAGFRRREADRRIVIAGIQSVYKRADALGRFNIVMVDEAHLIPADGEGMYRSFLQDAKILNPKLRVVGLTATPYRLDTGEICGPDRILSDVVYEAGVKTLIAQGFLCAVKTKSGCQSADLSGVHIRGGEYIPEEMAGAFEDQDLVTAACKEIVELTQERKAVLIFASGVRHGSMVVSTLRAIGVNDPDLGFVTGETPAGERAELIEEFKAGRLKYLVNVNVLTTGFDASNIDAIALLRATLSPGLYYQMVGRGLRTCEGKHDCLVLDYGTNALTHGPIDKIIVTKKRGNGTGEAPSKECPECKEIVFAGVSRCPSCGFEFPKPEIKHGTRADGTPILSGAIEEYEFTVARIEYHVHHKKGDPNAPTTMRVDYCPPGVFGYPKSEWVCFNHTGFARENAEKWWTKRTNLPCPPDTDTAVKLARAAVLPEPQKIIVRKVHGEKYERIVGYEPLKQKEYPQAEIDEVKAAYAEIQKDIQKPEWEKDSEKFFGKPVTVPADPEPYYDDNIPF